MPKSYAELLQVRETLEKHFKDVQDIEFTIQEGKLFMLQTRNGKRTAAAALKFAADMVKEKLIDAETAVLRNPADQLDQLLAPIFDLAEVKKATVIATGLPAGPGAASGKIYLNAERAVEAEKKGEKVLLVRVETSPEDLRGMIAAEGILTARGGVSSHAALVARQMGKVCVCGAAAVHVDYDKQTVTISGQTFKEGEYLSIDGTAGTVYAGEVKTAPSEIIAGLIHGDKAAQATEKFKNYNQLMKWCSQFTRLSVRTNADTPEQAANAVAFGAVGIGLTRTEHMFFEGNRIDAMREMILADTLEAREAALAKLLPYQRDDFFGIFKALKGYPGHDPFPRSAAARIPPEHQGIADGSRAEAQHPRRENHQPRPRTARVQSRCSVSVAAASASSSRKSPACNRAPCLKPPPMRRSKVSNRKPEVMIPLVGFKSELDLQVAIVHEVAALVMTEKKVKFTYSVGTMIEVPRGALTADEIAQTAEFFSFGTNDLTQTCLGMSRDDSGSFLGAYTENEIIKKNPFASIDQTGVGQLIEIAATKGNATRPGIKLGICGEHGGDPDSVKFCHRAGLTYVSCSPFRVPVARLAAAQAAIEEKRKAKAAKKK